MNTPSIQLQYAIEDVYLASRVRFSEGRINRRCAVGNQGPLAHVGDGSVFRCFIPSAGSLKPCAVKMITLSVGGTNAVEDPPRRNTRNCVLSSIFRGPTALKRM